MLGLVLEGGGARGAFQIGAFQALNEKGFRFDGVAGTSIGAINGALLAQGDFDLALAWWRRLNVNMLFDTHDERLDRLLSLEFDRDTLSYIATAARELVEKRGLDTAPIRRLCIGGSLLPCGQGMHGHTTTVYYTTKAGKCTSRGPFLHL